jgi:imidazolonepropionase-like amidohydrolase
LNELLERMAAIAGLRRAGTQVLVGSDSPFAGLVPGFALHDEAGLLVESGLSSLEVMRCLTAGNAAALRLNDVGVVAEGARADLVAFEGDPTQRIADLSTVRMVWRGGTPSSPCTLASAAVASFGGEPTSPVDQIAAQRYIPATADWPSQS